MLWRLALLSGQEMPQQASHEQLTSHSTHNCIVAMRYDSFHSSASKSLLLCFSATMSYCIAVFHCRMWLQDNLTLHFSCAIVEQSGRVVHWSGYAWPPNCWGPSPVGRRETVVSHAPALPGSCGGPGVTCNCWPFASAFAPGGKTQLTLEWQCEHKRKELKRTIKQVFHSNCAHFDLHTKPSPWRIKAREGDRASHRAAIMPLAFGGHCLPAQGRSVPATDMPGL